MRRFLITLLIISVCSALFSACDASVPQETLPKEALNDTGSDSQELQEDTVATIAESDSLEETTESESKNTTTETTPPEETEIPGRDLILYAADQVLLEKYKFSDSSIFKVTIEDQGYRYYVFYRLAIQGVSTAESYTIYLDKSYNLLETTTFRQGQYSKYLSDEEFLQKLSDAVELIGKKTAPYTSNPRYFLMEDSGYLCVYFEEIVDIDPPRVDDYGNTSGCNIDHEHIIFLEKICRLPY